MTDPLSPIDLAHLRRAIQVSIDARAHGNHPFGAVLVTADGRVLEAENTVITDDDVTCHAETNLIRRAWRERDATERLASTLYTSCEPCAMCAGALFWAGIGRMVFALSGRALIALAESGEDGRELDLSSREVLARGVPAVSVSGPHLEDEAAVPHRGFWR